MKKYLLVLSVAIFVCACSGPDSESVQGENKVVLKEEEIKRSEVKLNIVRLEKELFTVKSTADVEKFLLAHPRFVNEFLEIPNAHKERAFVEGMYNLFSNPALKQWNNEVQAYYSDFPEVQKQLEQAFSYLKFYYPDHYVPEINTIVTGFQYDRDFAFSDSLIVISIDYLMHDSARFRPQMYSYILDRYDKPYLVSMMMTAISGKYNLHNEKDETMMANMIHYGKAHYFVERMMPELADSLNIGYTHKEMKEVRQNLATIWGHFIEKKLFFETNPKLIQKYTGEAPTVTPIGDNCPGRIGRWLGWQIVRKYMEENPTVTIQQLMKEKDANKIFKESKYKGAQAAK